MNNKLAFILIGFLACLSLGGTVANGLLLVDFDGQECSGLDGTHDSICYRVSEIERHLHGNERWLGLHGTPVGEVTRMQEIGSTTTPFQMAGGTATWGAWVQVVGSGDTPVEDGMAYFDVHRIEIVARESNTTTHFIQLACGVDAATALDNGTYTEVIFQSVGAQARTSPIEIQQRRHAAGTKCWMRVWAVLADTSTVDFYIGLHEYEG